MAGERVADALVLARRLSAQLLVGPPAKDPVSVARRLLAVQGQDARGVRLAIRSRSSGLSVADFDRALTEERSLVITWLNRGTLHLVRREDYFWLHALTTAPLFTASARRLDQEGVSPSAAERGVEVIQQSLAEQGPMTRAQLGERIAAAGVRTEGQALIHLLALASHRGLVVRGPMIGAQHAYVLVQDWLGPTEPVDRDRALAELARRYLAGHAPADERDLAKWAGLPLRDARAGLKAIASELVERDQGLLEVSGAGEEHGLPAPRLLGSFDPVLLGWASREFIVGSHRVGIMVNGIFRPFALVRGRAAATWSITAGKVALEPLLELSANEAAALQADAQDVGRYLELG
jgi:Winged helix DNA-binding domain